MRMGVCGRCLSGAPPCAVGLVTRDPHAWACAASPAPPHLLAGGREDVGVARSGAPAGALGAAGHLRHRGSRATPRASAPTMQTRPCAGDDPCSKRRAAQLRFLLFPARSPVSPHGPPPLPPRSPPHLVWRQQHEVQVEGGVAARLEQRVLEVQARERGHHLRGREKGRRRGVGGGWEGVCAR
jgi:hypothetical protein